MELKTDYIHHKYLQLQRLCKCMQNWLCPKVRRQCLFPKLQHKIILHPSIEIPQTSPWEQVMGREGTDREIVKILFQITNVAMVKQRRSPPQVMKFEILRTQSVTTIYTISLSRNLEQKSLGCLTGSNTQWNSQ